MADPTLLGHARFPLWTCILFQALDVATSVGRVKGSPGCECLDELPPGVPSGNATYLPATYGLGCASHDFLLDAQCSSQQKGRHGCRKEWCYVDRWNCNVSFEIGGLFMNRSYSYATCGYLDTRLDLLHGTTLRALYVTNTGGYKGTFCSQGGVGKLGSLCDGALPQLIQAVADKANFTVHSLEEFDPLVITEAQRRNMSSDFDICILATGMGFADVCVSMIPTNAERASISQYIALEAAQGHLYTRGTTKGLWRTLAYMVLLPFTVPLWLTLIVVIFLLSFLLALHEGRVPGSELSWEKGPVRLVCYTVYSGLNMFLEQSADFPAATLEGKLTTLGFGFLVLLTISSYVASLTSMILNVQVSGSLTSIEDAIYLRKKICVLPGHVSSIVGQYPGLKPFLVEIRQRKEIPQALAASRCDVAVATKETYETWLGTGDDQSCELQQLEADIRLPYDSMFASAKAVNELDYWVETLRSDGEWARLTVRHKVRNACKTTKKPIEPHQQLGAFLLMAGFVALGIVVRLAREVYQRRARRKIPDAMETCEEAAKDEDTDFQTRLDKRLACVESQQEELLRRLRPGSAAPTSH